MKKSFITKATGLLAAGILAFGLTACGGADADTTDSSTTQTTDTAENTEAVTDTNDADTGDADAEKTAAITIEVKDADGNTTSFAGTTDDEFLFDAISDIDGVTIDGYESEWGYYITTVNGITADYDTDGAYWSIYVNGEYGQNGVSSQPITDGDVYSFVYEVYTAPETATITIEIKDAEGNITSFAGDTDDEFLFDALSDIEGVTIDGEDQSWGYMITTINGITADYDTDGAYWAIYVNGEYGQNGVQTQPVTDGDVYTFVYEVSNADAG